MRNLLSLTMAAGLLLAAAPALAQTWPALDEVPAVEKTGSGDVAVIVAVEDYAFLPDVPGATRNASDWERFLSDGLGVETVLMLTNQQAVREEILTFAKRAAGEVTEGSTLWFVFIGHGAPNKTADDGLLIGADGQQNTKSMNARGVPQKELLAALEAGGQAQTVVLLDACFSGRDASGGALAKGTMPVLPVDESPEVSGETVVMTAAKADEFAGDLPDAERPAFSYLVLGGMRGWADDGDGNVTVDEAVTFARRELLGIAGRQQTPQLHGKSSMVLARGVGEARPSKVEPNATVVAPRSPDSTPSSTVIDGATTVDSNDVDGIADNPLYIFAGLGGGAVDAIGSIGIAGDVGLGVKLNAFSDDNPNELRLGVRFGVAGAKNPDAPGPNETLPDGSQTFTDPIQETSTVGWIVGPEFGKSWRSESRPGVMGENVFTLSALALYGNINQCNGWEADATGTIRRIVCSTPKSAAGFGGGASFAAQFGLFRIGGLVAVLSEFPLYASLSAGLSFDR